MKFREVSCSSGKRLRLQLAILALFFCLTSLHDIALAGTFVGLAGGPTFNVGNRSKAVAVADFNGDGLPDIAVAGYGSSQINVFLSCATGTTNCANGFLPVSNIAVGAPIGIVAADVNGDGNMDLLVTSNGSDQLSLFTGHGDGTFSLSRCNAAGSLCKTGVGPVALAAGNLRGNAKEVDLVVVNTADNTISVMLGNGVNFNAPKTYGVGHLPSSVTIADINGDGHPDLLVTNATDNNISVLLGDGKGNFTVQPSPPSTDVNPICVTVADFNGDGIPDLATANSAGNDVSILIGIGNGTFQNAVNITAGSYPQSVAAADFNGDGHMDLAVADGFGNNVSIMLGNGDGTFRMGGQYASGARTVLGVIADVNADGKLDIVAVNADLLPGQVTILYGNGDGTFKTAVNYSTGLNPEAITFGDFNCDGKQDLAVANSGDNTVRLLLGNGDGTFQAGSLLHTDNHPLAIVAADFNRDGSTDLAVVNSLSGDVTVFLSTSTCSGFSSVNYFLGPGVNPVSMAVADFNGDGYPDIVVADAGSAISPGGVLVLLNNQDGSFGSPINTSAGVNPTSVAAADLNADHKQDIAVTTQAGGNVLVLLGNGDGTFTLKSTNCVGSIACKAVPVSVTIADFNGDGKLDLAVANYDDSSVSMLPGNGDGTFRAQKISVVGANPLFVAAAPLQGNSTQQDIVVANSESDTIAVLANQLNKSGGFKGANTHTYASGEAPAALAIMDFDGDGKLDVAVANQASNNVTVLKQQ